MKTEEKYYKELPLIKEINEEYKMWKTGDNILIGSAMSSGKTSFIINILAPYAKANNKKILLISNRIELKKENSSNISAGQLEKTIHNLTYQSIQSRVLSGKTKEDSIEKYDYIICDEAHYFLSESWNGLTTDSYETILNSFLPVKIFMSATFQDIFDLLKEDIIHQGNNIIEYGVVQNYDYINKIIFYKQDYYIENLIDRLPYRDKLIYFFRNIKKALELHNKYKDSSSFVCSKGRKEYAEFITPNALAENKLTKKLTFTSTVWDNGINIIDPAVKHVVIDIYELVELIQCLGRRRTFKGDSGITLHIRNWSNEKLNQFLFQHKINIKLVDEYESDPVKYLKLFKLNKSQMNNNIMFINPQTQMLTVNKLMYRNAQKIVNRNKIAMKMGYDNYIIATLNVKNFEYVDYEIDIKQTKIDNLQIYLDGIVGQKLFKEQQQDITNFIKEIPNMKSKYRITGKTIQSKKFNKLLKELKLNYEVSEPFQETMGVNRKKYYIIITEKTL